MNEVISGIQVIKMYCWEKPFSKLVSLVRKYASNKNFIQTLINVLQSNFRKEMEAIRGHAIIMGLIYSFEVFVARTAIFLSILGYVLLGNYVTAEKVFSITAIYNVLRPVITILFSISISSIAEVNVSICRVQKFLSYEEVSDKKEPKSTENGLDKHQSINSKPRKEYFTKPKLVLRNVCAKWEEENAENTLENIYLNISSHKLLAVTGPVGAGKSSLINVILKELPIHSGTMEIQGTVSYASQEPWLFSGKDFQKPVDIENNILTIF